MSARSFKDTKIAAKAKVSREPMQWVVVRMRVLNIDESTPDYVQGPFDSYLEASDYANRQVGDPEDWLACAFVRPGRYMEADK